MTGKLKVRFCGAEFVCLDDVEIGTKVDAVVRPEDVMITTPEQGAVKGVVTSVVSKVYTMRSPLSPEGMR